MKYAVYFRWFDSPDDTGVLFNGKEIKYLVVATEAETDETEPSGKYWYKTIDELKLNSIVDAHYFWGMYMKDSFIEAIDECFSTHEKLITKTTTSGDFIKNINQSHNLLWVRFDSEDNLIDAVWKHIAGGVGGVIVGPPPIIMPNGVDGYVCECCEQFCAYVTANTNSGYMCPSCRVPALAEVFR